MYSNLLKSQSRNVASSTRRLISLDGSRMLQKPNIKEECMTGEVIERAQSVSGTIKQQVTSKVNSIAFRENFASRHIGVNPKAESEMLKTLNLKVKF